MKIGGGKSVSHPVLSKRCQRFVGRGKVYLALVLRVEERGEKRKTKGSGGTGAKKRKGEGKKLPFQTVGFGKKKPNHRQKRVDARSPQEEKKEKGVRSPS